MKLRLAKIGFIAAVGVAQAIGATSSAARAVNLENQRLAPLKRFEIVMTAKDETPETFPDKPLAAGERMQSADRRRGPPLAGEMVVRRRDRIQATWTYAVTPL